MTTNREALFEAAKKMFNDAAQHRELIYEVHHRLEKESQLIVCIHYKEKSTTSSSTSSVTSRVMRPNIMDLFTEHQVSMMG